MSVEIALWRAVLRRCEARVFELEHRAFRLAASTGDCDGDLPPGLARRLDRWRRRRDAARGAVASLRRRSKRRQRLAPPRPDSLPSV